MSERVILASIPFHCSRALKDFDTKMPVDEVKKFIETQEQKVEMAEELCKTIAELPVKPDLVLFYKGTLVVMANVHSSSDAAVGNAINAIAKKDIVAVPAPKARKPRTAAATTEAPDVDVEVG